jgi:hypothetical protein
MPVAVEYESSDEFESESSDDDDQQDLTRGLAQRLGLGGREEDEVIGAPALKASASLVKGLASKNFTFEPSKQREIDRTNAVLLNKLAKISTGAEPVRTWSSSGASQWSGEVKPGSNAGVNRKRQNEIDRQNQMLAKRLASVKGTINSKPEVRKLYKRRPQLLA